MCDADLIESKGQNTVTGQPEESYVAKGGLCLARDFYKTGLLPAQACFLDGEVLMPDPDL